MKRTKKALTVLFALAFVFLMSPIVASAAEYTGSCGNPLMNGGNDVTWHFDSETHQLILSGDGDMADYASGEDAPWYAHAEEIDTVIFEAGVTSIGANAFNDYDGLGLYGVTFLNIAFRGPRPEKIGANAFPYQAGNKGVVHVPEEHAGGYANIVNDLGLDDGEDSWALTSKTIVMPFEIQGLRLPAAGSSPSETEVLYDGDRWYDLATTQWYEVVDGGPPISDPQYFEEDKEYFIIIGMQVDTETVPEYENAFYEYCHEKANLSGFTLPGLNVGTKFSTRSERWGVGGNSINLQFGFEGNYVTPSPFEPITDITDVPDEMVVGDTLTLTGTVLPEAAERQISYWEILPLETTADATLDTDTLTATTSGTIHVRAVVERGHSIEGDPTVTDDLTTFVDESKDFWKDFTISVKTAAAPTIDGPNSMTVTEGYAAASTPAFELTGWPTPAVTKLSGDTRMTWNSATNKLDIAPGLMAGDHTVTLNASNDTGSDEFTFTLTVKPSGTVTGEVRYDHNDPQIVDNPEDKVFVRVSLWKDGEQLDGTTENLELMLEEDMSRYYSFAGVADGWYTVVAESSHNNSYNDGYIITRDVYMKDGAVVDLPGVIVFTPGKTQTVLTVNGEVPAKNVATNDLPDLFSDYYGLVPSNLFSAEDTTLLNTGGTIEFKMDVAAVENADKNALDNAVPSNFESVLFLDFKLSIARIEAGDTSGDRTTLNDVSPALLELVVPLPPELIGKTIAAVYRAHAGITEPIIGAPNANGEYFTFDASRNTVYLYVNQFSAYAFAVAVPTRNSGGSGGSSAPATSVTLNKDNLSLSSGESETLTATVTPSSAADRGVTWTSSDPSVATVDKNGRVTAVKPGTAVITARSNSGGHPDTCTVTISDRPRLFIPDHTAYIVGYPDGTAGPNHPLTRAEAATVFFRLLTDEVRTENWTRDHTFADVGADHWHNNAVSTMSQMGIVEGYPDGTFHPDASITRAELATIAARFARDMGMAGANEISFRDIAGHWAAVDIQYTVSVGWMNGNPDGTFRPDQAITRAEFMTLVNRILERIPETTDDLLTDHMRVWPDNADTGAWYYIAVQEATNSHEAEYKDTTVPGLPFPYETWVEIVPNRNWAELEKTWSAANP